MAGFSPMMYMPLMTSSWMASTISTTVSPPLTGSSGRPHRLLDTRSRMCRVLDRPVVRDRTSGSDRRRTHPGRCSGRASGCRPGALPAHLAGGQRHGDIRQRALSVPWVCCEMPMPQKMIEPFRRGKDPRHLAQGVGLERRTPPAMASPVKSPSPCPSGPRSRTRVCLDVLLVIEIVFHDHRVQDRRSAWRHVAARLELQIGCVAWRIQDPSAAGADPSRSASCPAFDRLLEE